MWRARTTRMQTPARWRPMMRTSSLSLGHCAASLGRFEGSRPHNYRRILERNPDDDRSTVQSSGELAGKGEAGRHRGACALIPGGP